MRSNVVDLAEFRAKRRAEKIERAARRVLSTLSAERRLTLRDELEKAARQFAEAPGSSG